MKLKILFTGVLLLLCLYVYAQEAGKKAGVETSLIQYGALGAIVIAMGWYIIFLHKERSRERLQHNESMKQRDTMLQNQFDRMNENDKGHITLLTQIKTLLEVDIQLRKKE